MFPVLPVVNDFEFIAHLMISSPRRQKNELVVRDVGGGLALVSTTRRWPCFGQHRSAALMRMGREVVLVSSRRGGRGDAAPGLEKAPARRAASAAVGQMGLVRLTKAASSGLQHTPTAADPRRPCRPQALPQCATLGGLLELKVVPIINENDTRSPTKPASATTIPWAPITTSLSEADTLVILTDQSALFSADPRKDPAATLVRRGQGRRIRENGRGAGGETAAC